MKTTDIKRDDMGMVYLGMIALVAGGAWLLWVTSRPEVTYYGLHWTWQQLACFDWPGAPAFIRAWRNEAATLAAIPNSVPPAKVLDGLNRAGYLFIWVPIVISIRAFIRAHKHPANKTRRLITAESLPKIMAKHSPAVIPVLHYGDLLNADPAEHRRSLNPEEWVAQHALLVNGRLDREKCRELLQADLGKPITKLDDLAPHEKALFAVFGTRLLANGADHKEAQVLLDRLNRSCASGTWQGKAGYPDPSICDAAFAKYSVSPGAAAWCDKHPYPRTMLHAMHKASLAFGRLPSSHFRWLKGIDRTLWYALNTTGRKAPFVESAAVFSQTLWEDFAFEQGYRLTEPVLDDAIDGIEDYLVKIGLMASTRTKE
jgi:intracellular multiplication protein IcmP